MPISGDFAALDRLVSGLSRLRPEEESAQAAAKTIEAEVQSSLRNKRSPSGTVWPPKKDGSPRTLGSIPSSVSVEIQGGLVQTKSSKDHAIYHQDHFLPETLPKDWEKKIGDDITKAVKAKLGA